MNKYVLETPFLMTGSIFVVPPSQAEIKLLGMTLQPFKKQPDLGFAYVVSQEMDAADGLSALKASEALFARLEDVLSFYYSMPVVWQYWQRLLRRTDSDLAHLSVVRRRPGVALRDHGVLNDAVIAKINEISDSDTKFANCLYLYNALARIDTVELSRAQLPVMFSLVESIAKREEVEGCEHCGSSGYKRTSSAEIIKIIGKDLHEELYSRRVGEGDTIRNAVMHGNISSESLQNVTLALVNRLLIRLRSYIKDEHHLDGLKATSDVEDPSRYFYLLEGTQLGIRPREEWTIEDYMNEFNSDRILGDGHRLPKDW